MLRFGDYVIYNNKEVGRVVSVCEKDNSAFVCYGEGCTAARTPVRLLQKYKGPTDQYQNLGYHRFDSSCPDFDPDVCFCCNFEGEDL